MRQVRPERESDIQMSIIECFVKMLGTLLNTVYEDADVIQGVTF